MVRPDIAKWEQSLDDLRRLSIESAHPRTRERFLALYMIGSKQNNAASWAKETGRQIDTVLGWVHDYNDEGPDALIFRQTGGVRPFFRLSRSSN